MRAGAYPARRRTQPAATVTSRADWRGLLKLAADCAGSALNADEGLSLTDMGLATLGNRANGASTRVMEPAGAATTEAAKAFIALTRVFARRETSAELRRDLAPTVAAAAAFLDLQLHRLAATEFARAHVGRPEIYG